MSWKYPCDTPFNNAIKSDKMTPYSLYVIDDEQSIRDGITISIGDDYSIDSFQDAESAIAALQIRAEKCCSPDLVLMDIGLPGMSGIEALEKVKQIDPAIPVIMITAYEDIDSVISSMKLGAFDYVTKPLRMDILETAIKKAIETIRLRKEVRLLQKKYIKENMPCLIGESDTVQDMMDFIKMVAKSPDTPILILGGTGTGKELIAKAIHFRSPNFNAPLVEVNSASISPELIESEIFGYEPGAFSGAHPSGKKGLIEEARGGTLFLDEIGDLSLDAQAKILRFLENGEFYRVGGTKKIHLKTRVISATNKDIVKMSETGQFRKDLFFRLGVIKIEVPPLNERGEDILLLARYFLDQFAKKFAKKMVSISRGAEEALLNHDWTGNVRELKNAIERGVLIGKKSSLRAEDLGIGPSPAKQALREKNDDANAPDAYPPMPPDGMDLTAALMDMERHYIEQAWKSANGNSNQAARLLNLNHHTFRYRRKKRR